MTQQECNAAIGKLVRDYADNEIRLVALRRRIEEIATSLRVLGKKLERPRDVAVDEIAEVDFAGLRPVLVELHEAECAGTEMEVHLEAAGLGSLIRKRT